MYVVRLGQHDPLRRPAAPRPRRPGSLCALNLVPIRPASRSTTMEPTLWRFPAYPGPGLPRPDHQPRAAVLVSLCRCPSGSGSDIPLLSASRPRSRPSAPSAPSPRRLPRPRRRSSSVGSSIPTSASASASSASRPRRWAAVTLTTSGRGRRPASSPRAARRPWRGSGCRRCRPSMEMSTPFGMWVASASTDRVFSSCSSRSSGAARPRCGSRISTVTFSPRRTSDQVDVLEVALDRVALHGLRQRQLVRCRRCRW